MQRFYTSGVTRPVISALVVLAAAVLPTSSAGKAGQATKTALPPKAAPLPSAEQALGRTLEAHAKLGSATIRVTHEGEADGKPFPARVQTVQRNDPDHYVTEFTEGEVRVRLIARGDELVMHNVTRNAYRRGKNYRVDLAMPFSRVRDELAKGLKDPKTSAVLKRARVSRATVGGAPAYRLDWSEPVMLGTLPMKSLSIGVADGLMRQILLQDSKATLRATAQYTPRKAPFPADTFDFSPPPGARDLAAPTPETPTAPSDPERADSPGR